MARAGKETVRFKVEGLAFWASPDGQKFETGIHEVQADKALSRALAAAEAAGALIVVEGEVDASAIESDEDSARLDAAVTTARQELAEEREMALLAWNRKRAPEDTDDEHAAGVEELLQEYEVRAAAEAKKALKGKV